VPAQRTLTLADNLWGMASGFLDVQRVRIEVPSDDKKVRFKSERKSHFCAGQCGSLDVLGI